MAMRKSLVMSVIACIVLLQAGCGSTPQTVPETDMTYASAQQIQSQASAADNNVVTLYITDVQRSYKGVDGYSMSNGSREERTYQGLDDGCRFYNYSGEAIAFSEFADAVDAYKAKNTDGVMCSVQYSDKVIVEIRIADKAVEVTNSQSIEPTLFQRVN